MDKKNLLALLLAIILAFLAAIFISKPQKAQEIVEQQEVLVQQEEIIPEAQEEKIVEKSAVQSTKIPTKTMSVKSQAPVIKHVKVEEEKNNTEKVPESSFDAGIVKGDSSDTLVITREFKSQSQAKYVFEGYGVQKAPTK